MLESADEEDIEDDEVREWVMNSILDNAGDDGADDDELDVLEAKLNHVADQEGVFLEFED
jgi:hypothetical protein